MTLVLWCRNFGREFLRKGSVFIGKAWDHMCRSSGMGLRDFELFNQAMLAKQFWRLYSHPDSLIAWIFNARYFPNADLWSAKVGHYPSYGWRSLWGSRSVLFGGIWWKVGNGKVLRSIKMLG